MLLVLVLENLVEGEGLEFVALALVELVLELDPVKAQSVQ